MNQYDAFKARIYDQYFTGVAGDIAFFIEEAARTNEAVLELGCGTGRITIPLAKAGMSVVGLDSSPEMLQRAMGKLDLLGSAEQKQIQLVTADMVDFNLRRRFKTIIVPYRTFMHLLTPEDQVSSLLRIRKHLAPGGRLILDIYEPTLELLNHALPVNVLRFDVEFVDEQTQHRVCAWYRTQYDVIRQIIDQLFCFDEVDVAGSVLSRFYSPLMLRYSYRYEMHYLLELCGFQVLDLYGDFYRGPYIGSEQVWVAGLS